MMQLKNKIERALTGKDAAPAGDVTMATTSKSEDKWCQLERVRL